MALLAHLYKVIWEFLAHLLMGFHVTRPLGPIELNYKRLSRQNREKKDMRESGRTKKGREKWKGVGNESEREEITRVE